MEKYYIQVKKVTDPCPQCKGSGMVCDERFDEFWKKHYDPWDGYYGTRLKWYFREKYGLLSVPPKETKCPTCKGEGKVIEPIDVQLDESFRLYEKEIIP